MPGSLWSGDTSKFNDSHSSPPSSSLAALNPRFNQVDKDAECGCVETMISSDQGGGGGHGHPTCCDALLGQG